MTTSAGVARPSVTLTPVRSSVLPSGPTRLAVASGAWSEVLAATVVIQPARWLTVLAPGPELPAEAATKTPAL
jgi:hypothetical protein